MLEDVVDTVSRLLKSLPDDLMCPSTGKPDCSCKSYITSTLDWRFANIARNVCNDVFFNKNPILEVSLTISNERKKYASEISKSLYRLIPANIEILDAESIPIECLNYFNMTKDDWDNKIWRPFINALRELEGAAALAKKLAEM